MKIKIKKGDTVQVISGKDKGVSGKVLSVLPRDGRLVVEGVNVRWRHQKAKQSGKKGERVRVPMSMHASNVMIVCVSCGKPRRVSVRLNPDGIKERMCRKCHSTF